MSFSIDVTIKALRHEPVERLPRGELFIDQRFLDLHFGEFCGDYARQMAAASRALGMDLVGIDLSRERHRRLVRSEAFAGMEEFFIVGCLNGPVARLVHAQGFFKAMLSLRREPSAFTKRSDEAARRLEGSAAGFLANGFRAVAIADDIAGNGGLFFQPEQFEELICPAYKRLVEIVKSHNLYAFFHSDGEVGCIIEPLLNAGFDCLHTLDAQAGMDLYKLKGRFKERGSFMGHVDAIAWEDSCIEAEIERAEREFRTGA